VSRLAPWLVPRAHEGVPLLRDGGRCAACIAAASDHARPAPLQAEPQRSNSSSVQQGASPCRRRRRSALRRTSPGSNDAPRGRKTGEWRASRSANSSWLRLWLRLRGTRQRYPQAISCGLAQRLLPTRGRRPVDPSPTLTIRASTPILSPCPMQVAKLVRMTSRVDPRAWSRLSSCSIGAS
jgi:hypothetical protein